MPAERGATIVTGAGRGIGRALALGLVRAGRPVVIMDLDPATVRETCAEAANVAPAVPVLGLTGDITQEADAARVVAETLARFGTLVALVNNAGIGRSWIRPDALRRPIRFWELTLEQWRRFIEIDATGFFIMTQAALPALRKRGWGRVVTVTTSLDTMINPGSVGYGGAKAAVEASMATLAGDLAGSGVTANVLVPGGPVDTPAFPDDGVIPRSAFIRPEVMVPPLHWLLSPASDGVTGRRFIARLWDPALAPEAAAAVAGAPVAWSQLGVQQLLPEPLNALPLESNA